ARFATFQRLQTILNFLGPIGVVQHQLFQRATRLLQATQQLQNARITHAVVAQVQLAQATVRQQQARQAAATAVGNLAITQAQHTQGGTRLAQRLAQLLDAAVTQFVAAQLQFQQVLVLGQHQAHVLAARRGQAAAFNPQAFQLAARLQQAFAQQTRTLITQFVTRQAQFFQGLLRLQHTAQITATARGNVALPQPQGFQTARRAQQTRAQLRNTRIAQTVATQVQFTQARLARNDAAQILAVRRGQTAVFQTQGLQLARAIRQTLTQHTRTRFTDVVVANGQFFQRTGRTQHARQRLAARRGQTAIFQLQLLQVALRVQQTFAQQTQTRITQRVVAQVQLTQGRQATQGARQNTATRFGQAAVLQAQFLDLAGRALQTLQNQVHARITQFVGTQAQLGQARVRTQRATNVLAVFLGQTAIVQTNHLVLLQQRQQFGPTRIAQLLAVDVQVHSHGLVVVVGTQIWAVHVLAFEFSSSGFFHTRTAWHQTRRMMMMMVHMARTRTGQVSVEELFQLTFRQCTHFGCRHFTVFEQQQSRDTTDAIFRRSARVLIDVQFCNGQFALIFVSDFIQNRGDHFARTAPLCPEIDEDRPVRFEYIRVKTVVMSRINFAGSRSISILYAGRIVAGITGATGAVAGAYIADITDGEDRARHFGLMSACFGVGMVAGPVAGGLLGAISLHAPFLAAAVLNGLNLLLGCFLMQESHKGERRDPGHHRMAQNLSRYGMIAPGRESIQGGEC
ncbi:unnamed protein product, partial [Fusarium langsethiae]